MVLDLEVIKVMSRKMKFLGQGTQPRITYICHWIELKKLMWSMYGIEIRTEEVSKIETILNNSFFNFNAIIQLE